MINANPVIMAYIASVSFFLLCFSLFLFLLFLFFFSFFFLSLTQNDSIACPDCGQGTCNDGASGDGQCVCQTGWINSEGNNCNSCAAGYYGDGIGCYICNKNQYSIDGTICLSCPENSTSKLGSSSILDCKCDSFNYYPDNQTFTCLPCPLGYLLNESNICQSNSFLLFSFFFFPRVQ